MTLDEDPSVMSYLDKKRYVLQQEYADIEDSADQTNRGYLKILGRLLLMHAFVMFFSQGIFGSLAGVFYAWFFFLPWFVLLTGFGFIQ